LVVVVFGVVATLLMMLAAPLIIRLFMQDQTVISEGTTMIRWLASSTTLGGCILVFTTMFQSMGKAVPHFGCRFTARLDFFSLHRSSASSVWLLGNRFSSGRV
jgi:Na+-driven multidrug efflux pump